MKLSKNYTHIKLCPNTKKRLTEGEYAYSHGICPRCGNNAYSTFTHSMDIVGKWNTPSLLERLKGIKAEFIEKE